MMYLVKNQDLTLFLLFLLFLGPASGRYHVSGSPYLPLSFSSTPGNIGNVDVWTTSPFKGIVAVKMLEVVAPVILGPVRRIDAMTTRNNGVGFLAKGSPVNDKCPVLC
jgi:hypothetical protein